MDDPNAFTRLILSAHETEEQDYTITRRSDYARYVRAGEWAEHNGWEEDMTGVTHRRRGLSLSIDDGKLQVNVRRGTGETYRTRSAEQTLELLVMLGILPPVFSPAVQAVLEDVAIAHELMAEHIHSTHDNATMTAVAGTWQAAADSARCYLEARQRELAEGADVAVTV